MARGEPAAAAGGGGAARDAGGPAHRALPAHPAAAPGIHVHHVPALRAHHRGNRRARHAYSPPGSRGQPLPPAPPVRGVLASIHCCSSMDGENQRTWARVARCRTVGFGLWSHFARRTRVPSMAQKFAVASYRRHSCMAFALRSRYLMMGRFCFYMAVDAAYCCFHACWPTFLGLCHGAVIHPPFRPGPIRGIPFGLLLHVRPISF